MALLALITSIVLHLAAAGIFLFFLTGPLSLQYKAEKYVDVRIIGTPSAPPIMSVV